jgi:hypothetical protein
MNSKQGARYIKKRMGNDLKQKILAYNGITLPDDMIRKPSVIPCPRCELVNALDNKYCSKCSYPLVPSAFEEIKLAEEAKINCLKEEYESEMKQIRRELAPLLELKNTLIREGILTE